MADITLNASMRSNLLSLQNTQSLMDMTQERLSTGNKVNSAIDNPSAYYTAQSLNNRASDLSGLLDSMGQAIQTIKAANEGVEAITSFVEQAKAVANTALDTADEEQISSSQKQFNDILDQIDKLANDSGYKGVNLLQGDDLTVTFNEDRSSDIKIAGDHADSANLGIAKPTTWDAESEAVTEKQAARDELDTKDVTIEDTNAAATDYDSVEGVGDLKTAYTNAVDGTVGTAGGETYATAEEKAADVAAKKKAYQDAVDAAHAAAIKEADTALKTAKSENVKNNKTAIRTTIEQVDAAINTLRSMASTFGNNFSIVETRENFTESLINVLTEGADKLTLADMNEESANMLALQTRQQLAINSLSLASQASQSVLKLF